MNQNINDDEMEIDLLELFYYMRSKLVWLILAFVVGASVVGSMSYYLITPKYTATAKIYMVSASSDSVLNLSDLNIGTSLSSDYEELIKLRPVFNEVISNLGLDYEYEDLLERVSIDKLGDTRILKVSVEHEVPAMAQAIANELADVSVTYIPAVMETSTPNVAEYAVLPTEKSSPHNTKNAMIGGMGLLFVVGAIFVIAFLMDDTIKSAEDVEKVFGVMPLTVIPEGDMASISDEAEHSRSKRQRRRDRRRRRKKAKKGQKRR